MTIKSDNALNAYREMCILKESGETEFQVWISKHQRKEFNRMVKESNGFYLNGYIDGMIRVAYINR